MVTVKDILAFLETIAPAYMKMEWDNVGLLCGSESKTVKKVLVALDPFEAVCEEAAEWGADLIVTHHPLIFQGLKSVTDTTEVGRSIALLITNDISAVNAHTNLDCAPGGVNDTLAEILSLSDIQVLHPSGTTEAGEKWGLLRMGIVPQQNLAAFLGKVKTALGCPGLRYVSGCKPVHKVAVGGGSCGDELAAVITAGCDTFVTADIKYNQFADAVSMGMNLIDAGHFCTENPIVAVLTNKIQQAFPEIYVKASQVHRDCVNFY